MSPLAMRAALLACAAATAVLRGQERPPASLAPTVDMNEWKQVDRDDYRETHVLGGFRITFHDLQLSIRGQNALLLTDIEASRALLPTTRRDGLPQRGIELPAPRRRLSNDEIRDRLARSVRAVSQSDAARVDGLRDQFLDVPRYLYCDGGIVVVREGVEVLRCDRLWISPLDDRIVVENFELRYAAAPGKTANDALVVRGPRLVKEGARWIGRDVTLTTCSAGEPHYAIGCDEVEIVERTDEFEVFARGQWLQLGGRSILPLPNAHVFTGSQSQFPIKSASAGYSQKDGARTEIVFGLPWNGTGGAIHHWLTGQPAHKFRGDWELGVGWVEERGVPLDGVLDYRAPGLYEGRTETFWVDDRGEDRREITTWRDGVDIASGDRGLVRSRNRVHFGDHTHFDFTAFHGSDPAVLSEWFGGPYRNEEVPETSTYLHHADGNRLLTVGTRFNLSPFSYRDDRALADRFTEELPVVTYHWLAQPIGRTPWDTPIVVDLATEVGQRRSDYDDRLGFRFADRTLRADQLAEVSAPFHLGDLYVRPFVAGRGSFYDNTVAGDSEGRIAWTTGVHLGTRLSRTWSWLDDGERQGVRHVIAPRISWLDRFHVDDRASEFFAFDEIDRLDEEQLVRVELRNLFEAMDTTSAGSQPRDFLMLDLAQDLFPDGARDNGGDTLGLFYYDLLFRPRLQWLPLETLTYALYGDHDWDDGLRTFDTELQFGRVLGLTWTLDYRTDAVVDGAVGLTANTRLLDRWELQVGSQRDLERDEWLAYHFGVRRDDHDWAIQATAVYNPFAEETTFRLEFVPRLGSFSSPRGSRFDGFGGFAGPESFATSY